MPSFKLPGRFEKDMADIERLHNQVFARSVSDPTYETRTKSKMGRAMSEGVLEGIKHKKRVKEEFKKY